MRYKIYIFTLLTTFFFISCSSETSVPNNTAIKIDFSQIGNTPGYYWFAYPYSTYITDSSIINKIKSVYNPQIHKVICYSNLSCACTPVAKDFCYCIRAITDAGIDANHFEIYTMMNTTDSNPYMSELKVTALPCIAVLKNNVEVYSVLDEYQNNQDSTLSVEYFLLQGLSK